VSLPRPTDCSRREESAGARTSKRVASGCGRVESTTRALIFMVPETARTTRFHVFVYTRINDPRTAWMAPEAQRVARVLGWLEVWDDARVIPLVADTPFELKGMRVAGESE
jgi:hypothetical protein